MARREFPPVHASIPNLAPMVDVVMVILIFFMLGTSFAVSEGVLPAQLPSQVGPGGAAAVSIIPAIRIQLSTGADARACRLMVMDQEIPGGSFEALRQFLDARRQAGADPSGRVVIGAGAEVRYEHVIAAMDACVRAGFSNIQFSVESRGLSAVKIDSPPAP